MWWKNTINYQDRSQQDSFCEALSNATSWRLCWRHWASHWARNRCDASSKPQTWMATWMHNCRIHGHITKAIVMSRRYMPHGEIWSNHMRSKDATWCRYSRKLKLSLFSKSILLCLSWPYCLIQLHGKVMKSWTWKSMRSWSEKPCPERSSDGFRFVSTALPPSELL